MARKQRKIHLISLGCPKNLVDSEWLLGVMNARGFQATDRPEEAEVILVNTCAFIQPAVKESIDVLLEMAEFKRKGSARTLVATGCLPQRFQGDLSAALPEVDIFWGTGHLDNLIEILGKSDSGSQDPAVIRPKEASPFGEPAYLEPGFTADGPWPRRQVAPAFRAYFKIAEGCSRSCSFCLIPKLRGPFRSRPLPALMDEAATLVESGVQELILVAQDTTAYGRDLRPKTSLARLVDRLAGIAGLEWIRIMYAYPTGIGAELLEVMTSQPKVCSYLDMPLQHVARGLLGRMGRPVINLPGLIDKLRRRLPGLALRTTMMVGFPGETSEDFEELMAFVNQARFDRLGVFKFCAEDGVPATSLPDQIPQRTKEVRRRRLMAAQRRISRAANQVLVGRTLPVLIEGPSPETDLLWMGRTAGQAPEIDGQVYITQGTAIPGQIKPVKITQAHDYDLIGEIVEDFS